MIYGHDKTIHRTNHLDVELDDQGNVAAVWFRCLALPFRQYVATKTRAADMRRMYAENTMPPILAIETGETRDEPLRKFLSTWVHIAHQDDAYRELKELFKAASKAA